MRRWPQRVIKVENPYGLVTYSHPSLVQYIAHVPVVMLVYTNLLPCHGAKNTARPIIAVGCAI